MEQSKEISVKAEFYKENRSYYDRNADRYEKASWYYFNKYKNAMIRSELEIILQKLNKKKIKILEIGPGTGYILKKLLSFNKFEFAYTGIEHSKEMIKILSQNFEAYCSEFRIINETINLDNLVTIPLERSYDLIIGSSILHHLLDYENVIEFLETKLETGGILYFVREPIHKDDCRKTSGIVSITNKIFEMINNFLMKTTIKNYFYPDKIKAEDASNVAYYMFKDGVSKKIFYKLLTKNFNLLFERNYNRRVSSIMSYLENKWLKYFRKDILGNTLFSIGLQKNNEITSSGNQNKVSSGNQDIV